MCNICSSIAVKLYYDTSACSTCTCTTTFFAGIGTTFELQPQDTVIAIGGVGVLDCLSPPSLPPAQISWTKNFAQLPNSQRFTVLQNGSLMITGAELEDQGVYYCTATNTLLGISRTSQPAQVTTIGKSKI